MTVLSSRGVLWTVYLNYPAPIPKQKIRSANHVSGSTESVLTDSERAQGQHVEGILVRDERIQPTVGVRRHREHLNSQAPP